MDSAPELGDHRACTPVLVDDTISTRRTMVAALVTKGVRSELGTA